MAKKAQNTPYRTPHMDPISVNKLKDIVNNWQSGNFPRNSFFQGFEDPRRDLNRDCGYPSGPLLNPDRYRVLYDEDPIANRIVQLMPKECFQRAPAIFEDPNPGKITPFEEAWDNLTKTIRGEQCWFQDEIGSPIAEEWRKADILSGIGSFGIMLLGIDDGKNLDQPVDGVATLIPTANRKIAVNVAKDGKRVVRISRRITTNTIAGQTYERLMKDAPSRPTKEIDHRVYTKVTRNDKGEMVDESVKHHFMKGDEPIGGHEPIGGWDKYNERKKAARNATKSNGKLSPKASGSPVYSTSTPNTDSDNDSGDIDKLGSSSDSDNQNDIRGQKDATQPDKADPANKGSIAPTSFAGAQGTDAQYVGVELSPPEYPADKPEPEGRQLLFIRSFDESLVQIVQFEADLRNPRFGQPIMYRITLNDPRDQHSGVGLPIATVRVHWSRLIHICDNSGNVNSSIIFAPPRMRAPLHPVLDNMKTRGASAEGYWQSCFTKTSWETHPQLGGDVLIDEQRLRYMFYQLRNTLERDAVTSGMTAKSLAPEVVDPTPHITIQLEAICISLGCPVRVFKGSERGELASSQDDSDWNGRVAERQNNYLTPKLIVPFIDRLIAMGILPEPEGYSVEWDDLDSTTKKDKAAIMLQRTQAWAAYISGGMETVVPVPIFATQFDSMTDEQAQAMEEAAQIAQEAGLQTMPSPGEAGHPAEPQQPPMPSGMNPDDMSKFGGSGDAAASEYDDKQPSPSEPGADKQQPTSDNGGDSDESDTGSNRDNRAEVGN